MKMFAKVPLLLVTLCLALSLAACGGDPTVTINGTAYPLDIARLDLSGTGRPSY